MIEFIFLFINNNIFFLNKEPFEDEQDTYDRLWWLINNNKNLDNILDISDSIKYINNKYGMIYLK